MRRPLLLFTLIAIAAAACGDKGDPQKHPVPTVTTTAAASSDPTNEPDDVRTPAPPVTAGSLSSGAPASSVGRLHSLKKRAPVDDGAVSARIVFERAQKAFAENDDAIVFHCVAPPTRERWLGSMALSGELATVGSTKQKSARRAPVDELRAILDRYGATLSVDERLAGLSTGELQAALMRKVDDPTGLFAELLGWSARQGERTDPMQALAEPGARDGALSGDAGIRRVLRVQGAPDGGTQSGIAGVLDHLAAGASLGAMKVIVDSATAPIKRGGAANTGDVQRFVRLRGAWFLDE